MGHKSWCFHEYSRNILMRCHRRKRSMSILDLAKSPIKDWGILKIRMNLKILVFTLPGQWPCLQIDNIYICDFFLKKPLQERWKERFTAFVICHYILQTEDPRLWRKLWAETPRYAGISVLFPLTILQTIVELPHSATEEEEEDEEEKEYAYVKEHAALDHRITVKVQRKCQSQFIYNNVGHFMSSFQVFFYKQQFNWSQKPNPTERVHTFANLATFSLPARSSKRRKIRTLTDRDLGYTKPIL